MQSTTGESGFGILINNDIAFRNSLGSIQVVKRDKSLKEIGAFS